MNNSTFKQLKGITLAIPVFLVVLLCSSVHGQTVTQSNCFTIGYTTRPTSVALCSTNTCRTGEVEKQCDSCLIITLLTDKCPGLNPTTFSVTSDGTTSDEICYNVCGAPNLDFTVTHGPVADVLDCSWYNPRVIVYNQAGGIPDNTTTTFMICRSNATTERTFTISLPPGTACNGNPCTSATIKF